MSCAHTTLSAGAREKKKRKMPARRRVKEFQISRGNKNVFNIIKKQEEQSGRSWITQHSEVNGYLSPLSLLLLPHHISSRWWFRHILAKRIAKCVYGDLSLLPRDFYEAFSLSFVIYLRRYISCETGKDIACEIWIHEKHSLSLLGWRERENSSRSGHITLNEVNQRITWAFPFSSQFKLNKKGNFRKFSTNTNTHYVIADIVCWNFQISASVCCVAA